MSTGSTPSLSSTGHLQPEALCINKLDKIYLDLLHATNSVEKGNGAEVNSNLRQLESGIEQLREAVKAIADVDTNEHRQNSKINSLYRQIRLKDELINSFRSTEFLDPDTPQHLPNKLSHTLLCEICSSVVLREGAESNWTDRQFELPLPRQEKKVDHTQKESVSGFWSVVDMYTFENVGFTHAVDGVKYLTCADCEFGPIGYVDSQSKLHYVAPARLKIKRE